MGSWKNLSFRWGFTKNQYIGGIAWKRGLGQFADFRGAWQERGGVFEGGVDTPVYTDSSKQVVRMEEKERKILKIDIDDIATEELELLRIRANIEKLDNVVYVCNHHFNQYTLEYSKQIRKYEDP